MENRDDAALTAAMLVRGETVVSGMRLGHAPAACARHRAVAGGVDGAVLRADEAIRERWERIVTASLDDGDGGRLAGVLLGVSALAFGTMLGHLRVCHRHEMCSNKSTRQVTCVVEFASSVQMLS